MQQFDLIIRNCRMLAPDLTIVPDATLCILGGRIARILTGAGEQPGLSAETVLDGSGKLAMPGLVDAHTHAAQQLLRGSVTDEMPMIWARILVPFESSLTPADVYAGARLFCLENLKAGITAFADAGGPHAHAIAQAALETGIRAAITRSTMDQGAFVPPQMLDTPAQAVERTEALYREYHGAGNGRVQVWFGLRQAITCSPEMVERVTARARELGTGVHIHLAEHLDEVSYCLTHYRLRPAEWFDRFGLLGSWLLAAHCVRLADREVKLLVERGVSIVHCPRSNLGSHGFPKVPLFMALKASIGLGTDGASGNRLDLFEQMRLLKSATHARFGIEINDPIDLPALETLRMATRGGARALMLEDQIGVLEEGRKADIILLDITAPHISPTANLPKTIATTAAADDVRDVIVDGRLLVKDRAFLHLDEEEIRARAGEALRRVARQAGLDVTEGYWG